MFPAVRRWSPPKKASQLSFEWCGVGIHRKSRHMVVMFLVVRRCSPPQNALHDTIFLVVRRCNSSQEPSHRCHVSSGAAWASTQVSPIQSKQRLYLSKSNWADRPARGIHSTGLMIRTLVTEAGEPPNSPWQARSLEHRITGLEILAFRG